MDAASLGKSVHEPALVTDAQGMAGARTRQVTARESVLMAISLLS
jgi:hypothetical protein